MRTAIMLAAAAGFALAGCTTPNNGIDTSSLDDAISQGLPKLCQAAETAHNAFTVVAMTGEVSDATVRKERAAWESLEPLCADPEAQDTATVLIAAARAYIRISAALDDAEG